MPGDAKLGLVVGVGLVILVAVLFRRDGSLFLPAGPGPATSATSGVPGPIKTPLRPVAMRPSALSGLSVRVHKVEEGETLSALAERYYGDGGQSVLLLEANRDQLTEAEQVAPGMVLLVPELPRQVGEER